MGAKSDQLEPTIVGAPVNQNEIGFEMAVAVVFPLSAKRMIDMPHGQRSVFGEKINYCLKIFV